MAAMSCRANFSPSGSRFEIQQAGIAEIPMDNAWAKQKNMRTESFLFSSFTYPFL